jgi:hypothetical protein
MIRAMPGRQKSELPFLPQNAQIVCMRAALLSFLTRYRIRRAACASSPIFAPICATNRWIRRARRAHSPFLSNSAPYQRDESVNSSRASRTQPIFVEFCPIQRDELLDSSRASRTQPIFVEFCPYQRDESVNSSRDECHFADFCPNLRDESQDSLRRKCHFSGFCPKLRTQSDSGPGMGVLTERSAELELFACFLRSGS